MDYVVTTRSADALMRAVLSLKTMDEARRFFRDLLTPEEIAEFGRRWQAAKMLDVGAPYTEIVATTGLSSTTVARVSRWLKGPVGGYRLVLTRQRKLKKYGVRH
ncbi:MAG: helix-turn-helix domain-containing protein [Candidatus Kerfeldbacteria bacterium]|nr:helix-turn-helix domain-containing protein [Candidatus Kerfeldbacteria bacterium]